MRSIFISIFLLLTFNSVFAQLVDFDGKIIDLKNRPIPFASVWVEEIQKGTLVNEQGYYHLSLPPGVYSVSFRSPGFKPVLQSFRIKNSEFNHNVILENVTLITKTSNTADSVIRKVIEKPQPFQDPVYSGVLYRKALQRLIRVPKMPLKNDFAHELRINPARRGIINLSESIANYTTRSKNYLTEEVTAAKKASNSINVFNFERSPDLHVDFYQDIMHFNGFNEHAFVSPIAKNAFSFYYFQLTAQFTDEGRLVDEIRVTPIHRDEHLFAGHIYIVEKENSLYGVNLKLAKDAHLYFVDSVRIRQQFVPVRDNKWAPQAMRFGFFGKFWHLQYAGSFLQLFEEIRPDSVDKYGPYHEVFYSTRASYEKDDEYWDQKRPVLLNAEEQQFYRNTSVTVKKLTEKHLDDSLKNKNNVLRLLPYIIRGYTLHNYKTNTSWTFQSPYNMVFFNTVEGWGLDLKVRYTKQFDSSHNVTVIPEVRYGFSDRVLNANLYANYVYNPYKHASIYGRVGSDFLDLNNEGSISLFLNSLSTLFLGSNYLKLYQSKFVMAGTDGEVSNGVFLNGLIEYADRRSLFNTTLNTYKDSVLLTSNNPLDPNVNTPLFPHYRALDIRGSATFTFDQEYMVTPNGKYILPNPYPRVRVNYREGIPLFGSSVNYNFVSVDVFQDRLNLGIYGYSSYFISGGTFFNTRNLYYPDYMQFRGGESLFFNATVGSFHFLNYYTYSTDKTYFEAHLEHNFAGYFLSHIPFLSRLNLEEIIGGSYLNQGTLPQYSEFYFGLKRAVLRLDYGFAFGRFSSRLQGFRLVYNF
jgi:Family of unknown function (DUF5686)/CarboxypepD_reg-like domain